MTIPGETEAVTPEQRYLADLDDRLHEIKIIVMRMSDGRKPGGLIAEAVQKIAALRNDLFAMGDYEADAPRPKGSDQPNRGPDIERLLALLESAETGSHELDVAVHRAMGWELIQFDPGDGDILEYWRRGVDQIHADQRRSKYAYTQSLDASVTLVPPDANCHGYDFGPSGATAYVSRNDVPAGHCYFDADAPTAALALCIAAVKAHAHLLESAPSVEPSLDRGASPQESKDFPP